MDGKREISLNYDAVTSYLVQIERFGSRPGLERIIKLLNFLGNPEKNLNVIHVAGTNGKGSVCSMLQSVLMNAGYQVGMYTSPHLERYNERLKINNQDISNDDFTDIGEKVIWAAKKCVENGTEHPTVFECLTAMAFLYFYEKKVDFVVLEVGLGGRHDATNVIKKPLVSVITAIGKDHQDVLGNDIESIAYEKGGIIKKNCATVLYFPNRLVYNVINEICQKENSPLFYNSNIKFKDVRHSLDKMFFSIETDLYTYDGLELSLLGEHQLYNAATVLTTVEILKKQGVVIPESSIKQGLKDCYWPGRIEIIKKEPLVILDGSHNEESAQALSQFLKDYLNNKKITLLIGILKDKPYKKIIDTILPFAKKVIITEPDSPRKLSASELAELVKAYPVEFIKCPDIKEAVELAEKLLSEEDVLVCTGSLYLIGKVKSYLSKRGR